MLRRNALVADSGYRNILRKVPSGCVLYYPALPEGFEQGVIKDHSGSGNHGTITGAAWTRLPSGLPVLSLDGNDKVDAGNGASLGITANITLEAWVKHNGILATDQWIISKATATDQSYTLGLQDISVGSGVLTFIHHGVAERNGLTAISANVWHHLAATLDGANARLYVDGVLDNTIADISVISVSPGNLTIGSRSTPDEIFYLVGAIGIVRIYNRALSTAELANNYQRERDLFGV